MNRLVDKFAIILVCLIGFCMSDGFAEPVAALLAAAIASSSAQLLAGKKSASAIIAVFSSMCIVLPILFCAMPLVLYDALWEKRWWLTLPALAVLARPDQLSYRQLLVTAVGCLVAVIFYRRVYALEKTVRDLTSMRDSITEKNIRLARQNVRISEAQDNELHIVKLRERNRIAREIHDNVGHMLTRSILQSGALLVLNKDEQMAEGLKSLKDTLDSAMNGIRESVHDLHDDSLDLKMIIAESVSSVDKRFETTLDYDAGENIPGNIKLCVAAIVKESLSNAAKHSDGNRISVAFHEHPGFYQLMIEDNGRCAKISRSNGMGLNNMEERADSVGGRISFTPSENGFRVFMSVPKQI